MKNQRALGATILIVAILISASVILLYRLGAEPLQDYDEATYAEITSESLASHHFFSFTFLDNPYFNKPPLLFWLTDASKSIISSPELADRLPSALSALALIALMILITYEATGNPFAAAWGGAILLTTSAFIEPARQVRFDLLVTFFDLLAVYAFWKAFHPLNSRNSFRGRWFLIFGISVGLAVLAKGPIALYAVTPIFGIATVYQNFKWIRNPSFWWGILLSLLIILPWHLYETYRFGLTFWKTYLVDQLLNRVDEVFFTIHPTNMDYISYAFGFGAPWLAIFCVSIIVAIFIWNRISPSVRALFAASVIGVFSVFSVDFITKTKAFNYLIPLYPFVALCVSLMGYEIGRLRFPRIRTLLSLIAIVLTGMGLWLTIFNAFHINSYYASEVSLADQEKAIGTLLKEDHAPTFYVYDTTTLGSIMFYSGLVKPIFMGSATAAVSQGSFVLYETMQHDALIAKYPNLSGMPVYNGASLSLVQAQHV